MILESILHVLERALRPADTCTWTALLRSLTEQRMRLQ